MIQLTQPDLFWKIIILSLMVAFINISWVLLQVPSLLWHLLICLCRSWNVECLVNIAWILGYGGDFQMMFSSFGCMVKRLCWNFWIMLILIMKQLSTPGNGLKNNCHIWMFWFRLRIIGHPVMFIVNQRTYISIWTVDHAIRVMLRKEFLMGRH